MISPNNVIILIFILFRIGICHILIITINGSIRFRTGAGLPLLADALSFAFAAGC